MIRGQPKFDSVVVAKIDVSFLGPTLKFEGEGAFADTKTGQTHGWTRNSTWSAGTIEKLKELRASMELDLGTLHFEGGGEALVGPTSLSVQRGLASEGGGLGEHIGSEKVPSV